MGVRPKVTTSANKLQKKNHCCPDLCYRSLSLSDISLSTTFASCKHLQQLQQVPQKKAALATLIPVATPEKQAAHSLPVLRGSQVLVRRAGFSTSKLYQQIWKQNFWFLFPVWQLLHNMQSLCFTISENLGLIFTFFTG